MTAPLAHLHRWRRCILAVTIILWLGAFAATHTPLEDLPERMPSDKAMHFAGYLGVSAVVLLSLAAYGRGRVRRVVTLMVVMAAYGAFDELTQPLVNRFAAWSDWACDLAGAAAAAALVETLLALSSKKRLATEVAEEAEVRGEKTKG